MPGYDIKRLPPMVMIILGYALTILTILLAAFMLFALFIVIRFLPGSVTTTGTITHCTMQTVEQTDSKGRPDGTTKVCLPTAHFRTQAGQQIVFTNSAAGDYHVEETVPVRYHPATPRDAQIDDGASFWLAALTVGGVAIIFFIIGQIFIRTGKKRRKAERFFEKGV